MYAPKSKKGTTKPRAASTRTKKPKGKSGARTTKAAIQDRYRGKSGGRQLITRFRTIQRGPSLFSAESYVRIPFAETFQVTGNSATTTAVVGYSYRLNSIYDPRVDLGGGQGLGYDTLALNYSRYQVYKAKISVIFTDPNSDGAMVGYRIRTNYNSTTTSGRSLDAIMELPFTESKAINNTGQQSAVFSGYVDIAKAFAITRRQLYSDDGYGALFGGNPTLQVLLEPFILNRFTNNTQVSCTVKIIYYVKCSLPITVLDV